ncbi:MAG: flagellar motor protein MotB [Pseudomonadota bacterium]
MARYSSATHWRGRGQRRGESRRPGQWKLAYADFLTALVAFFVLLWVVADRSDGERQSIAAYIAGADVSTRTAVAATSNRWQLLSDTLKAEPWSSRDDHAVRVAALPDGLRLELSDTSTGALFANGETALTPSGKDLLRQIAPTLQAEAAQLTIEGHTDAFPSQLAGADNWTLSAGRALSARAAFIAFGVDPKKFKAVTGLADTAPLFPTRPHDPANRRISILLELSD